MNEDDQRWMNLEEKNIEEDELIIEIKTIVVPNISGLEVIML